MYLSSIVRFYLVAAATHEKMEKDFGGNYEMFMKRKEKYCSLKIKALLFDKILNKIANKRNNIQMITNFFN